MRNQYGLTEREHKIVAACYNYRYLTAEQLTRLYYGDSLSHVQSRLRDLAEREMLKRVLLRRPGRGGSSPIVYTPAWRGRRYLRDMGYKVQGRFRPSEEQERSDLHVTHTLELNELFIAAELLNRSTQPMRVDSYIHEHVFSRMKLPVTPDGWIDFRFREPDGGESQAAVFLELDRGTQDQAVIRSKVRRYLDYIPGDYRHYFGAVSGSVLFATTAGEDRTLQLLRWIEREVTPSTAQMFLVTPVSAKKLGLHYYLDPIAAHPFGKELVPILI